MISVGVVDIGNHMKLDQSVMNAEANDVSKVY
jgi:hypothetical protein